MTHAMKASEYHNLCLWQIDVKFKDPARSTNGSGHIQWQILHPLKQPSKPVCFEKYLNNPSSLSGLTSVGSKCNIVNAPTREHVTYNYWFLVTLFCLHFNRDVTLLDYEHIT